MKKFFVRRQKIQEGIVGGQNFSENSKKFWLKTRKSWPINSRGTRVCECFVKHGKKATQNAKKVQKE
ncbi:MAG: hypothetical protein IKA46_04025 [Clostridia bacterium]|nr:hypothetical protein [Clostridia bacterium]